MNQLGNRPRFHDGDENAAGPLVTIITPTYNRAQFLEETIESVLDQDYPRIEYIVLDDGSTDNTREILGRYGDRFHWESHPNMGQARTVNRGLDLARGDLIGLVNSDDPLPRGAIGPLVKAFCDEPNLVLAYPDWEIIDDDGACMARVTTPEYAFIDMVRWWACFPGPGLLFRREPALQVRGWDPSFRYIPDFEFYLRLGLAGPFRRVPRFLGKWRLHHGSISTSQRGEAMAREQAQAADQFFRRDDLPAEIIDVQDEVFRNVYLTCSSILCEDGAAPGGRFEIQDAFAKLVHYDYSARPMSPNPLAIIWRLHEENARCLREAQILQDANAAREAIIASLHQQVSQQDAEQSELRRQIENRNEWIAGLRRYEETQAGLISSLSREIDGLRQRVQRRDERIAWLRDTEQTQRDLIANLRAGNSSQRSHVAVLQEEAALRQALITRLRAKCVGSDNV